MIDVLAILLFAIVAWAWFHPADAGEWVAKFKRGQTR